MISLFSGQPANIDSASYRPDTASRVPQVAPEQNQPVSPQLPPATRVTLSPQAQDLLDQLKSSAEPEAIAMPKGSVTPLEADKLFKGIEIKMQLAKLDMTEQVRANGMDYYEKVRDTPPKPAVELNKDDAEAVLQMVRDMGRRVMPGYNTIFVEDGVRYVIRQDGGVTINEDGVATSRDDQKEILESMEDNMGFENGIMVDLNPQRDALNAQLAELYA